MKFVSKYKSILIFFVTMFLTSLVWDYFKNDSWFLFENLSSSLFASLGFAVVIFIWTSEKEKQK